MPLGKATSKSTGKDYFNFAVVQDNWFCVYISIGLYWLYDLLHWKWCILSPFISFHINGRIVILVWRGFPLISYSGRIWYDNMLLNQGLGYCSERYWYEVPFLLGTLAWNSRFRANIHRRKKNYLRKNTFHEFEYKYHIFFSFQIICKNEGVRGGHTFW